MMEKQKRRKSKLQTYEEFLKDYSQWKKEKAETSVKEDKANAKKD